MKPVTPDYAGLIRFLVEPFLETPDALKIDCEVLANRSRIWIRLAFEGTDKGRVFGRGGRNVQAIRTTIEGVAKAAGQTVNLDVYGSGREDSEDRPPRRDRPQGRPTPRTDAPKRPTREN
ncbi:MULTISPECIES: KH domain-containing protein [Leptolyngbya]|uniref:RNA-binding protein n=2 Tax=Leptolyngbya boryana TaxID=1184 RepID=A0A1Z4JJB1_LEPBY|nr:MULTISPECIES: KH domain-containing protein [Leptolyngbya]BAY56859.1 hypothetical protein NIES2135_37210 [Leptolyngbya boryana NIES-2135]MCY6494229.1 KH domain-containing protein [Leptolyngbya sp. GGD]ULP27999.1 KH domain-containing protein [Leptolyngbya boryana IU 594]WNZ44284.1 KH domain-containing protein [Leptolyngbya boryana CZ1]BAS56956.1 hypothetical protein LBWT_28830 [Leptolyngbya boryana IAM M-101]